MRPVPVGEAHPVVRGQLKAAVRARIGHHLSARHAVGIELIVPRGVERVGPVDPFAVAADLHHLGTASILLAARVLRAYIGRILEMPIFRMAKTQELSFFISPPEGFSA
jgi:hypothetical protein